MKDLLELARKMSTESLKMIFYGAKASFGVLLISFFAYKYNLRYIGDYAMGIICIELAKVGFSLLFQFVMGGIILDCVLKKR